MPLRHLRHCCIRKGYCAFGPNEQMEGCATKIDSSVNSPLLPVLIRVALISGCASEPSTSQTTNAWLQPPYSTDHKQVCRSFDSWQSAIFGPSFQPGFAICTTVASLSCC